MQSFTSDNQYRLLVENVMEAIFVVQDEKIVFHNKILSKLINRPSEDVRGYSISDFIHPDDRQLVVDRHHQRMAGESLPSKYSFRIIDSEGTIRWVELKVVMLSWEGHPATLCFMEDISSRISAIEELNNSKSRYENLYNNALVGLFRTTIIDGRILASNDCTAHMFGFESKSEFINSFRSTDYYVDANDREKMLQKIRTHGQIDGFECRFRRQDNSIFWVRFTAQLFEDEGFLEGVITDITGRKKTESQFNAILQTIPTGIMIIKKDEFIIVELNEAASRILGQTREEIIGNHCYNYFDCKNSIDCPCQKIDDKIQQLEQTLTKPDGDEIPVLKNVVSIDLDGQEHLLASFNDLTQLKIHENQLAKLSSAINQLPSMICITNIDDIIEYVNPQFCQTTGYEPLELIGKSASILYYGKQAKSLYKNLWQTISMGKTWTDLFQNRRKNGQLYWERKTISPILNTDGKITNYLSVGNDITKEILSQQKLAESDKLSAIGTLAAGVAHEFKNYLGGIIGNASFAYDQIIETEGKNLATDTLAQIIDIGEKANEVAMSLLSYSKANPDDSNRENLQELILKTISLVNKEMKLLMIEVATYFEDVPSFEMSASKIQQLILNLLINAQHAIKSNGAVTISLLHRENQAIIKIGDSGIGIPQDRIERIFDPFFSTKGVWGRDDLAGTGMGLSICRNITHEHNGEITAKSIEGVGTTFTITLPIPENDQTNITRNNKLSKPSTILFFSLNRSIAGRFHAEATSRNITFLVIDQLEQVFANNTDNITLIVCDAKFSGKMELLRMVQYSQDHGIPYVMINCGTPEYQLSEIFESAAGNHRDIPEFDRLISPARKLVLQA